VPGGEGELRAPRSSGTGVAVKRCALDVGGMRRTYWLAGSLGGQAGSLGGQAGSLGGRVPLLMALHGSGSTGRDMASPVVTGLATRGPAAVFGRVPRHLDASEILLDMMVASS